MIYTAIKLCGVLIFLKHRCHRAFLLLLYAWPAVMRGDFPLGMLRWQRNIQKLGQRY